MILQRISSGSKRVPGGFRRVTKCFMCDPKNFRVVAEGFRDIPVDLRGFKGVWGRKRDKFSDVLKPLPYPLKQPEIP